MSVVRAYVQMRLTFPTNGRAAPRRLPAFFLLKIPPEEGLDFADRYQNGFEAEIRDLAAG